MKRPMLGWLRWLLPPFALAGCLAFTTPSDAPKDVTPGTWGALARMPSERQEVAVAAAGAKVYVIGGFGDGFAPSTLVEAYEPATNRWESRAPLPIGVHHPAAVELGGKIYVMGGYSGRIQWTPEAALSSTTRRKTLGVTWRQCLRRGVGSRRPRSTAGSTRWAARSERASTPMRSMTPQPTAGARPTPCRPRATTWRR